MIKRVMVIGNKNSYNLEYFVMEALKNLNYDIEFFGYSSVKSLFSKDFARMLWTRSKIVRDLITPFYLRKVNNLIEHNVKSFKPDLIISLKGESILPKTINSIKNEKIKIVLWFPDDPRFFNSLTKYIAPNYDVIFTYSKNAIMLYNQINIKNIYRLHFGCSRELHKRENWDNKITNKVLFVGTFTPKRYKFLKEMIKNNIPVDIYGSLWPKYVGGIRVKKGVYGDNYIKLMQKYAIVLNIHNDIAYGPNMRVFESTGSGATLLTDNADDTSSFFENGKDILVYSDIYEAINIANKFLKNPNKDISKNAYMKCHQKYEYINIINRLMEICELNDKNPAINHENLTTQKL